MAWWSAAAQLHLEGGLPEEQDRFWREKPYEELYDLDADPDEVVNLVEEPDHGEHLDVLRAALDEHMVAINDNGFIPEGSAAEGWEQSRAPGAYPLEQLMELGALAAQRDPDGRPLDVTAAIAPTRRATSASAVPATSPRPAPPACSVASEIQNIVRDP